MKNLFYFILVSIILLSCSNSHTDTTKIDLRETDIISSKALIKLNEHKIEELLNKQSDHKLDSLKSSIEEINTITFNLISFIDKTKEALKNRLPKDENADWIEKFENKRVVDQHFFTEKNNKIFEEKLKIYHDTLTNQIQDEDIKTILLPHFSTKPILNMYGEETNYITYLFKDKSLLEVIAILEELKLFAIQIKREYLLNRI